MVNISHGQDLLQRALVVYEFCHFGTARDLAVDNAGGDGGVGSLARGKSGGEEVVESQWVSSEGVIC